MAFFGGSLRGEAWADGLERRDDGGWWPRFDLDVMTKTLREAIGQSYWDAWEAIHCPVLVLRAAHGIMSAAVTETMARRGRRVTVIELANAGHDLHLDRPTAWRTALSDFLAELDDAKAQAATAI